MSDIPVVLQMFTLRDAAAKDFTGTLKKVAQIGYAGVELAGTGGLSAADLKDVLAEDGLIAAASHAGLNALESDLDAVIAYNAELGVRHVVCPWLDADRRGDADGYRRVAALFNRIGGELKQAGLQFSYHNHAFEFERFDGEYGYDILMGETDPALVTIEMDTFWVKRGGEEPSDYMRKYTGRIPLLHLKDMTRGDDPTFAEVGEGAMDFASIFAAAETAGVEFYVVEQDVCVRPPLESVRISFENLRKMGIA